MISYQAPMLPNVNYQQIQDNDGLLFSLIDLEHDTLKNCSDFLDELKNVLLEEKLVQVHELMVAYLCAYLGTITTVHTVKGAEKLEPSIIALIKHQAFAAFEQFTQYPINSTVKSREQKLAYLEALRANTPGSIIVQTMRLGREIMDILEELANNRRMHFVYRNPPKQTELFCSTETLTKLMLLMGSKKCAKWREALDGLSDNYVLNQLAIQIGWLIGYFSHLENKSPDQTRYFDYGLPVVALYRKHVYQLMESYANAVHAQEENANPEHSEAEMLLRDIRQLSKKAYAQQLPSVSQFQKQVALSHADIENTLIGLLSDGFEVKIILMSLFYFWFVLEAPLCGADEKFIDNSDVIPHMIPIIELVKATTQSFLTPALSKEIRSLNEAMQKLKKHLPPPKILDEVTQEKVVKQTGHVNTAIYSIICDLMKQNRHIEAITNSLFCHWLRFSVFFGVSESEWQKMDYYVADIIKAVRNHLSTILDARREAQ